MSVIDEGVFTKGITCLKIIDCLIFGLVKRVDLDLGCDLVEETYLFAVVDGVCVRELACGLLFVLKED